ncbi:hypothetical protein PULV_a4268 [Pseudoalteromonas ulvae UL12]|uniref:DUF6531 domain-containing protein n=1 Tax=Pseudoalteromonas ulvae TaxID=107327 RepID=UPI00186B8B62|nr:DUF6531 domain-containing protein [Pseudoalteromonas ulvae]MBE0361862.1 hypothetical protein [Pseudoalteromonas ulvae UL12]
MRSLFSSNGLGLFNSLINKLGSEVDVLESQIGRSNSTMYVNAATGNLVVQNTDESIKGMGLGLNVLRTYNSLGNFDGDNNDQWRLGFIRSLSLEGVKNGSGSVVKKTTADGYEQTFKFDSTKGIYISTEGNGAHDVIKLNNDGTGELTFGENGHKEVYNTDYKLASFSDTNGHSTSINYKSGLVFSINTTTALPLQGFFDQNFR